MIAGCLTLVGIFAMRWNVVIGGQLFSKSFLGYTSYKMAFATREGLLRRSRFSCCHSRFSGAFSSCFPRGRRIGPPRLRLPRRHRPLRR